MPLFILFAQWAGTKDSALLEWLKQWDPQAKAELYNRFGQLTHPVIARIVGNGAVAEELTQEAFPQSWNESSDFDAVRGKWCPRLLTIARDRVIDGLCVKAGQQQWTTFDLTTLERATLLVGTENRMVDQQRAKRIRELFGKLNENQRRVLELACFEGVSRAEMAQQLGQPLGTIKTRVSIGTDYAQ